MGGRQKGRGLWEMWYKENSDYHQVVGDGASCQVCGPGCQVRVVESLFVCLFVCFVCL